MSSHNTSDAFSDGFEERTPSEIYDEITETALNRLPFITLLPRIVGSTPQPETLPWSLDDLATSLVKQGAVVSYAGMLQENLLKVRRDLVLQKVDDEITREYKLTSAEAGTGKPVAWEVNAYTSYGQDDQALADDPLPIEASMLFIHPFNDGVLQPVQKLYWRLENYACTLSKQLGGAALALIVLGFTGDWEEAMRQLASGPRIANFPGRGVSVERVGSTAVIDHILSVFLTLLPQYMRMTYTVDTAKGANTSGEAWSIRLEEMRYYVQRVQSEIQKICMAQGVEGVKFSNYQVTSPQTRGQSLDILDRLLAKGTELGQEVISVEEYIEAARRLLD